MKINELVGKKTPKEIKMIVKTKSILENNEIMLIY